MAPEIGTYNSPKPPQAAQALIGPGAAKNNGEVRRGSREVVQAESRHQEAEQKVHRARQQKQRAIERLREARAEEQKAEQQLREAQARKRQAVSSSQFDQSGIIINVLI